MEKEICSLLTSLGITSNYYGYYYISQAIQLTASGMENLLLVTKRLYPHIAQIYNTSSKNVERNIRHAVEIAWRTNRGLLWSVWVTTAPTLQAALWMHITTI